MSTENPYEAPKSQATRTRSNWKAVLGAVVIGILILPASAVAFFFSCLATLDVNDNSGNLPLVAGGIGGLLTFGLMGWAFVALIRASSRPPKEP